MLFQEKVKNAECFNIYTNWNDSLFQEKFWFLSFRN